MSHVPEDLFQPSEDGEEQRKKFLNAAELDRQEAHPAIMAAAEKLVEGKSIVEEDRHSTEEPPLSSNAAVRAVQIAVRKQHALLEQLKKAVEDPHWTAFYLLKHRREKEEFLSQLKWTYHSATEVALVMDGLRVIHRVADPGVGEKATWGYIETPQPTLVAVKKENYAGRVENEGESQAEERVLDRPITLPTFQAFLAYFLIRRQTLGDDELGPPKAPIVPPFKGKKRPGVAPQDYLTNYRMACDYLSIHRKELERFTQEIRQQEKWVGIAYPPHTGGPAAKLELGNLVVVRELVPSDPHQSPGWCVLFFKDNRARPMIVATFEQFAAYALAV